MRNSASDVVDVKAMDPATVTATSWCNYVDTNGYDQLDIVVQYKAGTADGSNYFTPTVQVASSSPGSTGSYAASTDYVGTVDVINSTTGGVFKVSYVGTTRYVTVKLTETGTASSIFAVSYHLSGAKKGPARSNTVTTGAIS